MLSSQLVSFSVEVGQIWINRVAPFDRVVIVGHSKDQPLSVITRNHNDPEGIYGVHLLVDFFQSRAPLNFLGQEELRSLTGVDDEVIVKILVQLIDDGGKFATISKELPEKQ